MIGNAFRSFIHATVPGNGRDEVGIIAIIQYHLFSVTSGRKVGKS